MIQNTRVGQVSIVHGISIEKTIIQKMNIGQVSIVQNISAGQTKI